MTNDKKPTVTVYTPCRHYGRFLGQAVESIVNQTYEDWELIIIDDGSTDETAAIAAHYAALRPDQVRVFSHPAPRGLQACANLAIDKARGEYMMRVDADDLLDENALLVLATYLDRHPEIGLVYPNYVYMDEHGNFLAVENRKKIGKEASLLDLPAHGAYTMVRKRILKSIGGYSESYDAQDGHELWLKVLHRYEVANVSTPLFFYRQHGESVSHDEGRILSARRRIKRGAAEKYEGGVAPRVVAVVPAKNTYTSSPDLVFREFAGRPLIDYTLETAREAGVFDRVFVTTDDTRVVEHCKRFPDVLAVLRSVELSLPHVLLSQVLYDAVCRLEQEHDIYPDILVLLNLHCPLRRAEHIREAVDTLVLYHADNVISVYEDYDLHFAHGKHGLEPLNRGMLQRLRLEREALYVDNGAINALWRDVLSERNLYGKSIGHIVMPIEESFQIKDAFHSWIVEQAIRRHAASPGAESHASGR